MSEHDRGAYTPPIDAPLSFDARQPVRGARPLPVTLIVSGLVLISLIVAIVLFYRSGVRQAGQPPQALGVPVAEMKSAPPPEAQPEDPAAGLQIYRSENGQPAVTAPAQPQFTAPPEQPQARAQPVPVVITPPAAAPAPAPPAPTALRPALATEPPPAPVEPVQAPAPKPAPAQKSASKTAPVAKAEPPPPAPAKSAGAASVQIGAVSSTALADKAWKEAVALAPGLAAGKGKGVEKISKNGGTLYRTAVTGFASKADAAAFCGKLKAAGKACFVK